jgi:glycosyltransferase involved in cell wall biosynthesis
MNTYIAKEMDKDMDTVVEKNMNKYPRIILFRHKQYETIDTYIEDNSANFVCSIYITDNTDNLNKLFNSNYHILVTYGNTSDEYDYFSNIIPARFSNRWIHKTQLDNIDEFNHNVNYCYIHNVIKSREDTRPIFSIFTTCFKSYDYINTAYTSLLKQSWLDWEWVVMDDTPEEGHFHFLQTKLSHDNRVRLYKRDKNSGNIGNVKNEVVSLCRGKYVLELDHDDEILESCLLDAYSIFQTDENIGFIYGDTINIYRNNMNYRYGDFICKGYGGYYMQKIRGNWVYVCITPNINNITLSHLVCMPNHPRIWKRSVLMECENYSEYLPICDDYEILLRTCCSKYKIVKNNKAQYIQYMNNDGNNFSIIRNAEINRIGPHYISPMFYTKYNVHNIMKERDAYENELYITHHSPIWKRDPEYEHKKTNLSYNFDYDIQYCIINDAIHNTNLLSTLYTNPRNDFIYLSNTLSHTDIQQNLELYGFDRMKCYSYLDCSDDELVKFFKQLYLHDNCKYEILHPDKSVKC